MRTASMTIDTTTGGISMIVAIADKGYRRELAFPQGTQVQQVKRLLDEMGMHCFGVQVKPGKQLYSYRQQMVARHWAA